MFLKLGQLFSGFFFLVQIEKYVREWSDSAETNVIAFHNMANYSFIKYDEVILIDKKNNTTFFIPENKISRFDGR